MLGEVLRGKEASELGIALLAPEGKLAETAYGLAERLAAMPSYAIKRIKENILQTIYSDIPRLTYMEADAMYDSSRTKDFEEAVNAFIEKREPVFCGK